MKFHVLTACDVALGAAPQPNYTALPCAPLVTHMDGTLVSASSPANFGETLTGLGVRAGADESVGIHRPKLKQKISAPAAETFNLDFNYSVNALATKPVPDQPRSNPDPPSLLRPRARLCRSLSGELHGSSGPAKRHRTLRASRLLRVGIQRATVEPHSEYRGAVFIRRSGHMREHADPCGLSLTTPLPIDLLSTSSPGRIWGRHRTSRFTHTGC